MSDLERPCFCVPERELTVPCPVCMSPRLVAVPFSVTGRQTRACPAHPYVSTPQLTELASWHHEDERGYIVCPACSTVLDELDLLPSVADLKDAESMSPQYRPAEDHFDRLKRERLGPFTAMDMWRTTVYPAERMAVERLRDILQDTEVLLTKTGLKHYKADVLHAVEAYYSTGKRSGGPGGTPRYEAVLTAITIRVVGARYPRPMGSIVDYLWDVYCANLSSSTRNTVSAGVEKWFRTYWKGEL